MKQRIFSVFLATVMFMSVVMVSTGATSQIISFVIEKPIYEVDDMVHATVTVDAAIGSWQIFWIKNGEITTEKATVKTASPLNGYWEVGKVSSTEYNGIALFAYTAQYDETSIPDDLTTGNPVIKKLFFTVFHEEQVLETFTDNLASSSAVNNHQFTLTEPGRVRLNFNRENLNNSNIRWRVLLRHADGTNMLEIEPRGNEVSTGSIYNYLGIGTYTLIVHSPGNPWSSINYTLSVLYTKNTGQFEIEHNNTAATATPMKVNSPITGNLNNSGDIDWYTFTLTEPGLVSMNFYRRNLNNSDVRWRVSLFRADGTNALEIEPRGNGVSTDSNSIFLGIGTYTVRVGRSTVFGFAASWSTASYTLTVNYEEVCNVCNKIPCECNNNPPGGFTFGDLNDDGVIGPADSILMAQYRANLQGGSFNLLATPSGKFVEAAVFIAGNVNSAGAPVVGGQDAIMLAQYRANQAAIAQGGTPPFTNTGKAGQPG
jgi:hypothetical protein